MSRRKLKIQDVVEGIYDGPHATPKKTEVGPYFLGISSLEEGRLDLSKSAHLSLKDFARWTRRVTPQANDLVFSYETRLGQAALIPDGLHCCLGRRMGLLRPNRDVVDPRYLLYVYLGPEFQNTLAKHSVTGSTVNRILLTELPEFPVVIHEDLEEQKSIARILGVLDDKIELNRKMNRTLEEIAQMLFRSWFVNFANETDGKEDQLPPGWRTGSLGEITDLVKETQKPLEEPSATWLLYSIPAFDDSARPILELGSEIKSNKYSVPENAVLFSRLNPRIPRIWRVEDESNPKAVCSTELMPLVPKNPRWLPYLFELMSSKPMQEEIQSRVTGTTGSRQRIKVTDVPKLPVPRPPDDSLLEEFSDRVRPLHRRTDLNRRQNDTLTEIRDTLLPKLISGEIRVPEAEEMVEDAA